MSQSEYSSRGSARKASGRARNRMHQPPGENDNAAPPQRPVVPRNQSSFGLGLGAGDTKAPQRPMWSRGRGHAVPRSGAQVTGIVENLRHPMNHLVKPPLPDVQAAVPNTNTELAIKKPSENMPFPLEGIDIPEQSGLSYKIERPASSLGVNGKQGCTGMPVELITNYFPITSYANWALYQYRVDFYPEEDFIRTKKKLLNQHHEYLGGYLFDGTMLFSPKKFNPDTFELKATHCVDTDKTVVITIKFTNIIESGDHMYIQVFNLNLRKCMKMLDLKMIGRNFYDPLAKINLPNYKLQLWPGYETTIGKYENDILLCVEISTKVLRQETVLDLLNECANDRSSNKNWMEHFQSIVLGSTVITLYNNETYRIDDIDNSANPYSEFEKKDGTKMTFIDYYKKKWNATIRNCSQPMLVSKKKRILQLGIEDTLIYLVPELCVLSGLTDSMRNNFNLMRDIATITRKSPQERLTRLSNFAKRLLSNEESVAELNKWDLKLSNSLISVTGRVLPPESIKLQNKLCNSSTEGNWTPHLRSAPMFASAKVNNWVIVVPNNYVNELKLFTQTLLKAANGMNFMLPNPSVISLEDVKSTTYIKHIEIIINEKNPAMIMCIIPSSRGELYGIIKRKLCIDRAIPSQVVLVKNVLKPNITVCTKIAIQLNCKMGGAPWAVNIPKKGMMIVGFDVCHDVQRKNVSYGALVATLGDTHSTYFSCVNRHESGEDLSINFAAGVSKALLKYKQRNGILPTSIVVYRDSVGDGQIFHVMNIEVNLMKKTFETIYGSNSVPFAFILVTKRISSRFIYECKEKNIKPQNPVVGTVVDTVITDPSKYDFFLVSQHVSQGTVTPTHYQVIEDTLKLPPDIIQRLTFKLTHLYYNWSGTVRVPAPCQLAHKLAFLTSTALKGVPDSALDELLYFL